MTICIAAIGKYKRGANEQEAIVFATDHMVGVPVGQFEHAIEKYKKISENCIAMFASNNALLFNEIVEGLDGNIDFNILCNDIFEKMKKLRLEKIEREVLSSFDVNLSFVKNILDKPIQNQVINQILETVAKYSLQSQLLLIGFKDSKAQISEITEMGHWQLRDINFGAIGSGYAQAVNTLLFQKHSKKDNLETTVYNVYKAKKNSEVSQGVGKETDLLVLFQEGAVSIESKDLERVNNIYEKELKYGKQHDDLKQIIEGYIR